jgi:ACS family tartrate transporter-like MFS transporter
VDKALERQTIAKVSWRLLPLIVVIYFVAYIDRTNVGFAAFGMNKDLGFTAYIYGWGAGIFFLGYFLFEVPSNVILAKVGARRWIARIMITWGIVAAAMAFTSGPISFLVLRFLLGAAEAGFFPGIILYFTFWFPKVYRARVIAALFLAVPGSNAVTAVLSGALLQMDGVMGVAGWKWLFVLEAIPSIILAFVVLALLTDRPALAKWLKPEERDWLEAELEGERREIEAGYGSLSLKQAFTNPRVIALSLVYMAIVTATYGITFFLPLIVKGAGFSDAKTGIITAIPYVVGTIGMVLWSFSSDRKKERRWHFIIACIVAATGLLAAGWLGGSYWALAAMSLATVGLYGSKPAFWPLPSEFLSGKGAACGIALINSIGNLGGFAGPYAVGWLKDSTGSYQSGLYFLAACALLSAIIASLTVHRSSAANRAARGLMRNSVGA